MSETYLARQTRRSNDQRARFLIDGWDDTTKPALDRIEAATLTYLHVLEMARAELMRADDVAAIDALACDTAGGTMDVINHLLATQRRELDDIGGNPDEMRLDLSALEEAHATLEKRWDARKPT